MNRTAEFAVVGITGSLGRPSRLHETVKRAGAGRMGTPQFLLEDKMMDTKKLLMSVGTAIAASKVARTISGIEMEDVLGTVGLARRRSHVLENLALVGLGALVGASAAILFAPMAGRDTRQRLGEEATRLGQAAKDAIREHKDEAFRSLSETAKSAMASHES